MDIIFASFTGLAILCGLDEVRARGRVGPFSPLLLGLAVLTKGPLCLVFALLALGRGFISPFAPLALAPAAAWWGTASARSPGLTDKIVSQLARGGSGEATTHVGPFHEYAAALFPLAFPAIVPLALAGIACVVARRRIVDVGREVLADDERKRLLRWFAGGLLFLSALAIKQSSYALPIYAPLALLGAAAAERAVPARALRAGAVGLAGAIAVAALVCGHLAGVRLLEPALGAAAAGAGLVLAIRAGSGVAAYRRALLAGIPALLLGILPLIHKNQRDRSLVPVGERIRAEIGRGRAIGLLETSGPHAEPIAWGAGEDLPVFDTVEAARARGVTCAVREIKEGRAGEGGDLPVLLDLPHPRHHNRRLQVVDLTVPPR
jgi:4-amino-4-deoxy-L-arabinose transferase-like glycosyltransferase